jgi:multiple sugar transport system ATP-binding protein
VKVSESDGGLWVSNEGIHIKVPAELGAHLRRYVGEHVTLGIRPEDLHVASGNDPVGVGFDAIVEVIEKLGSEILLDVKVGPHVMVAAVEPTVRTKVRDRLPLALNPDRLHFFDRQSEVAI